MKDCNCVGRGSASACVTAGSRDRAFIVKGKEQTASTLPQLPATSPSDLSLSTDVENLENKDKVHASRT